MGSIRVVGLEIPHSYQTSVVPNSGHSQMSDAG